MYYTIPSTADPNHYAGWLEGPHRSYYSYKLYAMEKHLIYRCLEMLLYAEWKQLGILNPYAKEFYPLIKSKHVGIATKARSKKTELDKNHRCKKLKIAAVENHNFDYTKIIHSKQTTNNKSY